MSRKFSSVHSTGTIVCQPNGNIIPWISLSLRTEPKNIQTNGIRKTTTITA